MNSRLPFILIALLCIYNQSAGELIQVPRNTIAKVNQSTYFNCSTSLVAREIFWYHEKKYVYTGEVFDDYNGRVSIDVDDATGACNLVIHSVQLSDAGEYKCRDDEGFGKEGSAQLTVLDGDPICQSNVELNDVIGQNACNFNKDEVQLSCSVKFNGNIPPHFEWKKIEDDINIIENISKMTYDSVDSVEAVTAFKGAHLTCVANTTFDCKYRWYRGNDSICPVSCNQHLTADFLGDYHCEAACTVRRKDCTFVAMKVFVIPDPAEHAVERIGGYPAIVAIGILGTCLLSAAGVAIFRCLNPRKPRTIAEAVRLFEFSCDLLDRADPKDKEAYWRKAGRDPSVIGDRTREIVGQLWFGRMFPAATSTGEGQTEHPIYSELYTELIADEGDTDDARTSIERTSRQSVYDTIDICHEKVEQRYG